MSTKKGDRQGTAKDSVINRSHIEIWKMNELAILNEIRRSGKPRSPRYKYSCLSRQSNNALICICSLSVCAPCVIWDMINCTAYNCCRKSCKHGYWIESIFNAIDEKNTELQNELRKMIAQASNIKMYDNEIMGIVYTYIREYDQVKETSPKVASIIENELVSWIQMMYPVFHAFLKIRNNSKMADIREVLRDYSIYAPSYQRMV